MALQPQIVKLVEKLAELTSHSKIVWETTAEEDAFLTAAGNSIVTVSRDTGFDEDRDYRIRLLNSSGQVVEEASASRNDYLFDTAPFPGRRQDFQKIRDLHELARRSALHADKAVADLLASLEKIA